MASKENSKDKVEKTINESMTMATSPEPPIVGKYPLSVRDMSNLEKEDFLMVVQMMEKDPDETSIERLRFALRSLLRIREVERVEGEDYLKELKKTQDERDTYKMLAELYEDAKGEIMFPFPEKIRKEISDSCWRFLEENPELENEYFPMKKRQDNEKTPFSFSPYKFLLPESPYHLMWIKIAEEFDKNHNEFLKKKLEGESIEDPKARSKAAKKAQGKVVVPGITTAGLKVKGLTLDELKMLKDFKEKEKAYSLKYSKKRQSSYFLSK